MCFPFYVRLFFELINFFRNVDVKEHLVFYSWTKQLLEEVYLGALRRILYITVIAWIWFLDRKKAGLTVSHRFDWERDSRFYYGCYVPCVALISNALITLMHVHHLSKSRWVQLIANHFQIAPFFQSGL